MAAPDTLNALAVVLGQGMPWLVRMLRERVGDLDGENEALMAENAALRARVKTLSRLVRTLDADLEQLRETHEVLGDMVRDVILSIRAGRFVEDDDFGDLASWVGAEGPMLLPREDVNMEAVSDESDDDDDSDSSGMYD